MSKSNNWIQTIQQLMRASKYQQCFCSTKKLMSEHWVWQWRTLYINMHRLFLSAFSSLWHSCLSVSYLDSAFVQTPLSYWQTWQHQPFFTFCIRQNPHSFLLKFTVNIISLRLNHNLVAVLSAQLKKNLQFIHDLLLFQHSEMHILLDRSYIDDKIMANWFIHS
jgi:hypothetical protein